MENYDYVIVGAGSAGCVLANKLCEYEELKYNLSSSIRYSRRTQ